MTLSASRLPEQLAVVRCPSCLGLRTVAFRNRDTAPLCPDCRAGEVVSRETYRARPKAAELLREHDA